MAHILVQHGSTSKGSVNMRRGCWAFKGLCVFHIHSFVCFDFFLGKWRVGRSGSCRSHSHFVGFPHVLFISCTKSVPMDGNVNLLHFFPIR